VLLGHIDGVLKGLAPLNSSLTVRGRGKFHRLRGCWTHILNCGANNVYRGERTPTCRIESLNLSDNALTLYKIVGSLYKLGIVHFAGSIGALAATVMLTIIELTISALNNQVVLDDGRCTFRNLPVYCHGAAVA
jgi:hypothetical protein